MKSNVTLKSNIFVRAGTAGNSVPLWDDTAFLNAVSGHAALKKLQKLNPEEFQKSATATQKNELKRFGICEHNTDGLRGEVAFGLSGSDGVVSCRCEHEECEFFGECMKHAGAKHIRRDPPATPDEPENIFSENMFPENIFKDSKVTNFLTSLDALNTESDKEMNSEIEAFEAEIAVIEAEATKDKNAQWRVAEEIAEDFFDAMAEETLNFEQLDGFTEFTELLDAQPLDAQLEEAETLEAIETEPPATKEVKNEAKHVSTAGLISDITELPKNSKVTIVCENESDIYFISRLFRKHGVPHHAKYKKPSLSRIYADLFWDYSNEMMPADMFMDRYAARVYHSRGSLPLPDAEEIWRELAQFQVKTKLCAGRLTDRLVNYSNGIDVPVPAVFLSDYSSSGSGIEIGLFDTVNRIPDTSESFCFFYADASRDALPEVSNDSDFEMKIANFAELKIDGDGENIKFFRLENQGGAETVLPPETNRDSFITADTKSPVQTQAYISQKIKVGDPLTRQGGKILHDGVVIGTGRRFSEKNKELYVRNIVSLVCKRGQKLPMWFGQSRTWLGIEID